MDAESDEPTVTASPTGDTYIIEGRRPDMDGPVRFHVGRSSDRTHWLIYASNGIPLLRTAQREEAINFALGLVQAEGSSA